MRTLRGVDTQNYVVRGCHSTVFVTPLPRWVRIESDFHQDATKKVQRLFRDQVISWTSSVPEKSAIGFKGHKPKQQSQTSLDYSVRSSQGSNDTEILKVKSSDYKPGPIDSL